MVCGQTCLAFSPFGQLCEEPHKVGAEMNSVPTESNLDFSRIFYRNSEQ